ncbi:MAG: hypothetical protein P1V81_13625 [Planctomycetota bacterium]|nr:hypothetical protein [Planctomycetota bacterium]
MLTKLVGRMTGLTAGGLLLLGASLAVYAGGGDYTFGDDLIGTLPVVYPETPTDGLDSGPHGVGVDVASSPKASFTMFGQAKDIEEAITDAYGDGWVEVEKTEDPQVLAYLFHGDVNLVLNRESIESGRVQFVQRISSTELGGQGLVDWKGTIVNTFDLAKQTYEVPFAKLLRSGIADAGTVSLILVGRDGGVTYIDLDCYGDDAYVTQLNY